MISLLPSIVQEWQKGLNQKLEPFLQQKESLKDEEIVKLGKKDPEAYPLTTFRRYDLVFLTHNIIFFFSLRATCDLIGTESGRNFLFRLALGG